MASVLHPSDGLHGYISAPVNSPDSRFGSGVSFYTSVWPLLERPLEGFQMGLPSTWITPDNADATAPLCPIGTSARDAAEDEMANKPRQDWDWAKRMEHQFRGVFQTLEGGVGVWTSTAFPSTSPKYRINGVPDCYTNQLSSPGFGFLGDVVPDDTLGVAQLSNRCLLPVDGLPFAPQTDGAMRDELLGIAWMALPLTAPKGWFRLETEADHDAGKSLEGNRIDPRSSLGGASFMAPTGNFSGQMFRFATSGTAPGYCHLETLFLQSDGKALEGNVVAQGSTLGGAAFMAPKGDFTGQLWRAIPDGGGYVRLVTMLSFDRGECLDSNPTVPGADLHGAVHMAARVDEGEAAKSQRWRLVPLPHGPGPTAGEQSWTLFVSSRNFAGPVACFLPTAWSRVAHLNGTWHEGPLGQTLDVKPADMGAGAMEIACGPSYQEDVGDDRYVRIPALRFPTTTREGATVSPMMQDITFYSPKAIAGRLADWMCGATNTCRPDFDPDGARPADVSTPEGNGFDLDQLRRQHVLDVSSRVKVVRLDGSSWGLEWEDGHPSGVLPEYFHADISPDAPVPRRFRPITVEELPAGSELPGSEFTEAAPRARGAQGASNAWTAPGPVTRSDGGVIEQSVQLADGSTVRYRWYRFRDQPVFARAGYDDAELDELQRRVERIHREWRVTDSYLAPPSSGELVSLDPAVLVTPPPGYEVGYVPIVVEQSIGP